MPKKTPRHGFGAGKYEMDLVLDVLSEEELGDAKRAQVESARDLAGLFD